MTPHQLRVIQYNNDIHSAYKWLWALDRHHGIHCGFFDETTHRHVDAVLNMNRVMAATVRITCDDAVLDAGCGIAGSGIWIAREVGARVTGMNINHAQLQKAQRLIVRYGLGSKIDLCLGDYSRSAFKSCSFDVVWFLESLCCSEDKALTIQESYRILQPGGRIVIADAFLQREIQTAEERKLVADWGRGWGVPDVLSEAAFTRLLVDAGFAGVQFRHHTNNVIPSSRRIFITSLFLKPVARIFCGLGLRSSLQLDSIVSGLNQYYVRELNIGIYGIVSATKPVL